MYLLYTYRLCVSFIVSIAIARSHIVRRIRPYIVPIHRLCISFIYIVSMSISCIVYVYRVRISFMYIVSTCRLCMSISCIVYRCYSHASVGGGAGDHSILQHAITYLTVMLLPQGRAICEGAAVGGGAG